MTAPPIPEYANDELLPITACMVSVGSKVLCGLEDVKLALVPTTAFMVSEGRIVPRDMTAEELPPYPTRLPVLDEGSSRYSSSLMD